MTHRCGSLFLLFAAVAVADCADATDRVPASNSVSVDPGVVDTIWLISSRHLPSQVGCATDSPPLRFWRVDCAGRTSPASRADFVRESAGRMICIYVHGNRIPSEDAVQRGLRVYRTLKTAPHDEGPLCFVVWSWPSDTIRGPIRDARAKAARTNAEAFYMAPLLRELGSAKPTVLIGFSFGARIITGALHLLAGGDLRGRSLLLDRPHVMHARLVLMASALDDDWLLPGRPHGLAITQIERLLLLNNSRDHALRRYWVVSRSHRVPALGFAGLRSFRALGDARNRVNQYDISGWAGREHSLASYLGTPAISRLIARGALPYRH